MVIELIKESPIKKSMKMAMLGENVIMVGKKEIIAEYVIAKQKDYFGFFGAGYLVMTSNAKYLEVFMLKQLSKLSKSAKLCAIYTNFDCTTKFDAGFVLHCDNSYVILEMYDPYGHYDGIGCFDAETIYQIETDNQYLCALRKLIDHYGRKSLEESNWGIDDVLTIIEKENRICEISLCESHKCDVVGLITNIDDNSIELECIDEYGKKCGSTKVMRRFISYISFDSEDMIKTETLRHLA